MLSHLLRQFIRSCGIFFRTIRAFFTRKLVGAWSKLRRFSNFSRQATAVASKSFQGAASTLKKPTRREDYIETSRLYISKSFLILMAVALVLFGIFCYFVAWPFILSRFLTARFYHEDSRIPEWSGKVIVCYDKKKRIPMYSGRLEEGVLQGAGKEYDEDGLVTYEGGFLDGARAGDGIGYDAGVLVYEGQFEKGVYEGDGKLYENGKLVYRGQFSKGLPNGVGTAYADGKKCYAGDFVDGVYEGQGAAYDETGWMCYRGSFSEGLYHGDGTLYLTNGDSIHSIFAAGAAGGIIQWYKGGRLWYDGSAVDLTPDGYGTIFARSGKVIYAGEMDRGSLDGGWMLTLTAQELREAFGDASVTETGRTGAGFLMINNDLGLTVLCTFRQGEEESQTYRIWFDPKEGTNEEALLPWAGRREAERWAQRDRDTLEKRRLRTKGQTFLPAGGIGGDWYQSVFDYEDHSRSLVSENVESVPFLIIWAKPGGLDLPFPDEADETMAEAQERLDGLLEALESVGGSSSGSGAGAGTGSGNSADPADVERLLELILTPKDAYSLMNALTDYYVYSRSVEALEASRPLVEQELVERQRQLEREQTTQAAVDGAQEKLDELDHQLARYRIVEEQAKLIGERLTGFKLDSYDLAAVLQVFDVTELDAAALYDAAVDYAEKISAGRYQVDEAQMELDVKTQVLDLTLAYENVRAGQRSLERTAALLDEISQAYAMGTADKEALYDAQCAVNEATAGQFQTMGAYTKLVNRLNDLSGGWLARQYDWFAEPFGVLYETAVRQAQAEAEAEKQQPADTVPDEDPDGLKESEPVPEPSASEPAVPEENGEEQAVG